MAGGGGSTQDKASGKTSGDAQAQQYLGSLAKSGMLDPESSSVPSYLRTAVKAGPNSFGQQAYGAAQPSFAQNPFRTAPISQAQSFNPNQASQLAAQYGAYHQGITNAMDKTQVDMRAQALAAQQAYERALAAKEAQAKAQEEANRIAQEQLKWQQNYGGDGGGFGSYASGGLADLYRGFQQ